MNRNRFIALLIGVFFPSALGLLGGNQSQAGEQYEELLARYRTALEASPDDIDLLCRFSDACGRAILKTSDGAQKRKLGEESLHYALRAVEKKSTSALAQRTLAIAYGRLARLLAPRTQIRYAGLIREHAETAFSLNPEDPVTCHLLGMWHFEMARLNPLLQTMASAIYGPLPQGTLKEAIHYLEKAVQFNPENGESWYFLGEAYWLTGKKTRARFAFKAAIGTDGLSDDLRKKASRHLR